MAFLYVIQCKKKANNNKVLYPDNGPLERWNRKFKAESRYKTLVAEYLAWEQRTVDILHDKCK